MTHSFSIGAIRAGLYEDMLASGWRRSGHNLYQNHCPGCNCCTPARVPVDRFVPTKSQRRVLRRNDDVTVSLGPTDGGDEVYELYRRYVAARHSTAQGPFELPGERNQFDRFLTNSPVLSQCMKYRVDGKLVGVGWIDVLRHGLSSVYFAFDPDESRRSLGTFSIMEEIRIARALDKRWLYLGFYVPGSRKMLYKGHFHPREFAVSGRWTNAEDSIPCD